MKKIIFYPSIVFLALVFFEIFLRYSPFFYGISPVEYDKDLGMWHKKSFSNFSINKCYKVRYKFDKEGKIQNDYMYDKSKQDIVLLGDSRVEALMVENKNILHNSLHKALGGKYNVLNYGLSGTGPAQQLQILKTKVNLSNTKEIIQFIFLENDLNDGDPKNFNGTNRPKVYMNFTDLDNFEIIKPRTYNYKEKVRDFLGQFEIYVYLKKTIYYYQDKLIKITHRSQNKTSKRPTVKLYNLINEKYKWKQLQGAIYQTKKIADKHNIKYKLIVDSKYEFNDNYTVKRNILDSFLDENDIEHFNIVPFLKQLSKKQRLYFVCDGHWNDKTHVEIAKFIKEKILD